MTKGTTIKEMKKREPPTAYRISPKVKKKLREMADQRGLTINDIIELMLTRLEKIK